MRLDAIKIGRNPPEDVNVVIEVPIGGEPIKYEMDKEAGALFVDRFLYTPMRYPGNYGFIPHTLSVTTLGAAKYGEGIFNAEMDVSNLFYALGAVGGILYVALIVMILRRALSMWRLRRDALDLAQLGLLVVTLLAWLLGGEYSIAALLWFSIGALERASVERTAEQREKRRNAYRLGHA